VLKDYFRGESEENIYKTRKDLTVLFAVAAAPL